MAVMQLYKGPVKYLLFGLFLFFTFSLFSNQTTRAYTCDFSGKGGNGHEGQWELQMEGGNCYYMEPDDVDNTQRHMQFDNRGNPINDPNTGKQAFTCSGGTVPHDDGSCWTYKKTYTSYKPTFDDGTEIPDSVFQSICEQQPAYYGRHYNYNEAHNACESAGGCWNTPDSHSDPGGGLTGAITGQTCRKVGDGTKTIEDVLGEDETKSNDPNNDEDDEDKEAEGPTKPPRDTEDFPTCGDARVNLIVCDDGKTGAGALNEVLKVGIFVLTILIGVAATGGLAYASVLYAKAEDDGGKVSEARGLIRNIVIGIILYVFMVGLINMLVPGGIIQ